MATLEEMWAEEEANTPLTTTQMWQKEDEAVNDQGTISTSRLSSCSTLSQHIPTIMINTRKTK